MAQSSMLIKTLKRLLKERNVTYRQIALQLGLSEACIKRQFATGSFTLERLDQICSLIDLEITDLAAQADTETRKIDELTEAQEMELVSDPRLLLVAFLVVNGWSFNAITRQYRLSEPELIRCLVALDRLKLIELLPNNRVRHLTSKNFLWRKNGPILRFFTEYMKREYFEGEFQAANEMLVFVPGMLSDASCKTLLKKIEQLAHEFNVLSGQDAELPIEQKSAFSAVFALRPWKPGIFASLRKTSGDTPA